MIRDVTLRASPRTFSVTDAAAAAADDIFSSQSRLALISPAVAVSKTFVRSAGLEPCDPVIKSHVLYRLSYKRFLPRANRDSNPDKRINSPP